MTREELAGCIGACPAETAMAQAFRRAWAGLIITTADMDTGG